MAAISEVQDLAVSGRGEETPGSGESRGGNGAHVRLDPVGEAHELPPSVGEAHELPLQGEGDEAGSGAAESAEPAGGQDEDLAPLQQVLELQAQSDRLRDQLAQRDEEVLRLRSSLSEAAMKYRQALLEAYPVIPEQLLSGATVEELEQSLERARAAVEMVRKKLEEDMARSLSVPVGAPVRRGPDLSAFSPREKILYGLRTGGHSA